MWRFFFDVDGVLLDFETSYVKALKAYFKLEVPEDYRPNCWYFSDLLNEKQMLEGWNYFVSSDYFSQLAPLMEVATFNQVFGDASVHIVTNIPEKYLPARSKNLKDLGLKYDSMHAGGFLSFNGEPPVTKGDVIQSKIEQGDRVFFIDDHPENCTEVATRYPESVVWLMTRPFNKDFQHEFIQRADTWDQVFNSARCLLGQTDSKAAH